MFNSGTKNSRMFLEQYARCERDSKSPFTPKLAELLDSKPIYIFCQLQKKLPIAHRHKEWVLNEIYYIYNTVPEFK